ncbi:hypothetical protein E1261_09315 [Kribbella albertanoniae]|uniref:Uncharacterized protein n=1 Tax=Kribbella albertanoniae TaxID=1266829 RepID=A0A4R4Q9X7_9ACTN|nr:hypothetical protein E1261_09315 [Kribbella albertanoniae]
MERAVSPVVRYPHMRLEVIAAMRSLSDRRHGEVQWGRVEEGVSYYDDLTLNVHTLYDDSMVLPEPSEAVPDVLHQEEVPAFRDLGRVLGPMLQDLGDRPDADYLSDPRWSDVVRAAQAALEVMRARDEMDSNMSSPS